MITEVSFQPPHIASKLLEMWHSTARNILEEVKSCVVVLERLDEKLLSRYLEKYDSYPNEMANFVKSSTDQSESSATHSNNYPTTSESKEDNMGLKLKESVTRKIYKKRKRKCLSDSESTIKQSLDKIKKKHKTMKNIEISASGAGDSINLETTDSQVETQRNELTLTNLLGSTPWMTGETEVFQENINVKKVTGEIQIETVNTDVNYEPSFVQNELREDNEDDRATIIFDRSLREREEIDKGEVLCPSNEVSGTEIADWRRRKPIESSGYDLVYVRPRSPNVGKPGEKPVRNVNIKEYYLNQMCSLVKRLYELYRIISQLQRELPKNSELAVHFSEVIKVQKVNFFKEIQANQSTISDCYEKLSYLYGNNTEKVVSEISKNAFLSAEDVCYIISRCFLVNENTEIDKINDVYIEEQEKQSSFILPGTSEGTRRKFKENLLKLLALKKYSKDKQMASQTHSVFPNEDFNYQQNLRPPGQLVVPRALPPMAQAQRSSGNPRPNALPSHSNTLVQIPSQSHLRAQDQVAIRQSSQHDLFLRYPGLVSWCTVGPMTNRPPLNLRLPSTYPQHTMSSASYINPSVNLAQQRTHPESLASGNIRNLMYIQPCTTVQSYGQPNSATYQSSQSNFGSSVALNSSVNRAVRPRNNVERQFGYPSNIYNRFVGPQRQVPTFLGEPRCDTDYFNDSVGLSSQKLYQKPHEELVGVQDILGGHYSTGELVHSSRRVPQNPLDPTVPQKLTMKNYRLQAEPTQMLGTEEIVVEAIEGLTSQETKEYSASQEERFRSRVFFCAQSGCRSPGILICKGCESVIYCSEKCQKKHWASKHKTECSQLNELRGS